jgi:hypothetical protein
MQLKEQVVLREDKEPLLKEQQEDRVLKGFKVYKARHSIYYYESQNW